MQLLLNKKIIFDSGDPTSEPTENISNIDFQSEVMKFNDFNSTFSSLSGSFSIAYNECVFSLNKTTYQPIPKPEPEHQIIKAEQIIEDGNEIDIEILQ